MDDIPSLEAHPAAWRGDELLSRPDWIHHYDVSGLKASLTDIQDRLETGSGAAMLRGYPIADLDEDRAREVFLDFSNIGTPISQSAAGERIFSVRDAGLPDSDPRARGPITRNKLSYHTDRCDVIGFLCLQKAKEGGENDIVSSVAIFNEIRRTRPDLLEVLMQPFCYLRHTVDTGNDRPWCRQPVFSWYEGHFASNLLRVLIERAHAHPDLPSLTDIQREALDFVEEVADRPGMHVTFMQEPGDVLFLNNWVTLHRRSEFVDHDDPARKRHLLRVWLSVPNSRPIHPDFAGNYGATGAGEIRGGMQAAAT